MWLFSFFFLHTPTLFLPNKRFRWGGAGWSLGWDASFRRVKPTVPCPGRKKRKRKKEYKLLMVRTTNSRRRAFPPSGRCSSYCTRSHSAGARSHAHAWLKCCFHRPKKRRKPLGVILYCLFFFSHQSRVWVRLHMVWEIHEHAEGCYHPCKNEAIPAQS